MRSHPSPCRPVLHWSKRFPCCCFGRGTLPLPQPHWALGRQRSFDWKLVVSFLLFSLLRHQQSSRSCPVPQYLETSCAHADVFGLCLDRWAGRAAVSSQLLEGEAWAGQWCFKEGPFECEDWQEQWDQMVSFNQPDLCKKLRQFLFQSSLPCSACSATCTFKVDRLFPQTLLGPGWQAGCQSYSIFCFACGQRRNCPQKPCARLWVLGTLFSGIMLALFGASGSISCVLWKCIWWRALSRLWSALALTGRAGTHIRTGPHPVFNRLQFHHA